MDRVKGSRGRRRRIGGACTGPRQVVLLEEYAGAVPERLGALSLEERHRVYRAMRQRAVLTPSGDLELSGDVMPASVCRTETSFLLD